MKEKIGEFICTRNTEGKVEMVYEPAPGAPELTEEQKATNKLICDGFALLVNSYDGDIDKAMYDIVGKLEEEEQELKNQIKLLKAEGCTNE